MIGRVGGKMQRRKKCVNSVYFSLLLKTSKTHFKDLVESV